MQVGYYCNSPTAYTVYDNLKAQKSQVSTTTKFDNNQSEWLASGIHQSLIDLNLRQPEESEIADWYFQYLPKSARRNDGRIRSGYLKAYANPLQGGWAIAGYDPTDWQSEPDLRCFKPNIPRIGKDGKPVKYDFPKNGKHNPILARVSYIAAFRVFSQAGLNSHKLTQTYASEEIVQIIDENAECPWFWQAVADHPKISISLAEGGKKALALLSQGICAIAVTSITTWRAERGSNQLHPWLSVFASNRHFYLTFDQDIKRATIKAVNRQCVRLGTSLVRAGALRVKRISWSGTAKGIDDFIAKIQEKYGDNYVQKLLDKCYLNARDYKSFSQSTQLPGVIKKVNRQFFSIDDFSEAYQFKIIIIKGEKGTGKTGVLSELIARDLRNGTPTLNISYLERLGIDTSIRVDLPYRTDKDTTQLRNSVGYSLCIDSLSPKNSIPFHAEDWTDAAICLDEFTQTSQHLAFGNTEIRKSRKLISQQLGQKVADCVKHNKPIYLLDADTNPESIEFIYDLIQLYSDEEISREQLESQTLTVVNEYQPPKGDLHFFREPSPKAIRAELTTRMKRGENLLLLSSSQKSRSGDGTKNLEKLARKFYKSREILRIDSKTIKDPKHPAFGITTEQLIDLIKRGVYKVIIASPSLCTGISIHGVDGYFSAVFSFQSGNITPNAVRQQLTRLRDFQAPRYVWCAQIGKSFAGSRSTNPIELITDQKGQAKALLSSLGFREVEKFLEYNICPLTNFWAKVGAKKNAINYHYREVLLADLEAEGWNIIIVQPEPDNDQSKAAWQERIEIQKESKQENVKSIDQSQDLTNQQARQIDRSSSQTSDEVAALTKHKIKQKYGVEKVSPELINADLQNLYPALRLRYCLTLGREYLVDNDRNLIDKQRENNDGNIFIPDLNSSTSILQVKLLEILNPYISVIYRPGSEWSNKSPELKKLKKFVLKDLVRFNQILKCGVAKTDSPITIIQKILKAIGQKLPCLRNERDGKKRLRIYGAAVSRFVVLHQLEDEIFSSWLKQEKQPDFKRSKPCSIRDKDIFSSGAA